MHPDFIWHVKIRIRRGYLIIMHRSSGISLGFSRHFKILRINLEISYLEYRSQKSDFREQIPLFSQKFLQVKFSLQKILKIYFLKNFWLSQKRDFPTNRWITYPGYTTIPHLISLKLNYKNTFFKNWVKFHILWWFKWVVNLSEFLNLLLDFSQVLRFFLKQGLKLLIEVLEFRKI